MTPIRHFAAVMASLGLCAAAAAPGAVAQTPPPSPPDPPPPAEPATPAEPAEPGEPPPSPQPQPALPVAEAVRLGQAALEAIDAGGDPRSLLAEIVGYVRIIQSGEPAHPWLPYITGRARLLAGQKVDGIRDMQTFTRSPQGRTEWKAFLVLGDALVEEFPSLAEAEYRRALALHGQSPEVHIGLSRVARKQGRAAESLEEAQAALRLEGGVTIANLAYLAELLRAMGQIENAVTVSRRAVDAARAQQQAQLADVRGLQVLQTQIQFHMVILRDWITANPKDAGAYLTFSRLGEELGGIEEMIQCHNAISALEQGIARLESDASLSLKLERARLLAEVGRRDEAVQAYEAILLIEPDDPAAQAGLDRLRAGP